MTLRHTAEQITPWGFEGISLFAVAKFVWEGMRKGRLATRASAISFKILLALAPTIILVFTLIPYIPISDFQSNLIEGIEGLLPHSAYQLVQGTLMNLIGYKHQTFLSISFVLGLYYASNSIMAIFEGFSASYHVQQRLHPLRSRLVAIVLVFLLPFLIVPPFLVITTSEWILNYLTQSGLLKEGIEIFLVLVSKWFTVLLFFNLAIAVIYYVGNPRQKTFRYLTPGSILATLSFIAVSQGFAYYVNHFGNYNKFYGSLGTIVVLLVWIEFNSIILLIGYELNASIQKALGNAEKTEKSLKQTI